MHFVRFFGVVAIVASGLAGRASATLIFSENFDAVPSPKHLDNDDTNLNYVFKGTATTVQTVSSIIPDGSPNLRIVTNAVLNPAHLVAVGATGLPESSITSLGFTLRIDQVSGSTLVFGMDAATSLSSSVMSYSSILWAVQLQSGNIQSRTSSTSFTTISNPNTLKDDQLYDIQVVANGSADAVPYIGGTLAAKQLHVWVNGSLWGTAGIVDAVDAKSFRIFSLGGNGGNQFEIDNVRVWSGAVPEPGVAAMLALPCAAAMARRRR